MLSLKMLKLLKTYTCNLKSLTQLRGKQHYISGGGNYNRFYLLKLFDNISIIPYRLKKNFIGIYIWLLFRGRFAKF